jgi:ATP-dependent DNA ligase
MASKKRLEARLQFALPSRYKQLPITTPHYVEPYLGGVRAALIFRGVKGVAVTLLGRAIPNAANILAEIEASDLAENIVIDGELVNRYDKKRTAEVTSCTKFMRDEIDFFAHDVMAIEQWDSKICEMPLHYRKSILASLLIRANYQRTLFTPAAFANGIDEMKKLQRGYKAQGYEAAVYKDTSSPYTFGPSLDWLVDRT